MVNNSLMYELKEICVSLRAEAELWVSEEHSLLPEPWKRETDWILRCLVEREKKKTIMKGKETTDMGWFSQKLETPLWKVLKPVQLHNTHQSELLPKKDFNENIQREHKSRTFSSSWRSCLLLASREQRFCSGATTVQMHRPSGSCAELYTCHPSLGLIWV